MVDTYVSVVPIVTSMIIFLLIISQAATEPMSIGAFLAFNAAFSQFLSACIQIMESVESVLGAVPQYQRSKPIFETLPESDDEKSDPGELTGKLEINQVSFSYDSDSPPVLENITIFANPGEFIALVGPSGSGKSTIARLLLGFEKADSGSIFYDERDINGLDVRALRRQMGVVLQNGQVMSGDMMENIIGSAFLTVEDAWEAARMSGLEDDIRAMPMGMHTIVSDGGSTLSGGQRQRLLIARALVRKPKILIFDEATSALDNETQSVVNRSLEKLNTTRIVIAHRLSTIVNADRIYVIEKGRVVQSGKYSELIKTKGVFSDIARRQIS
jgi:ATP-binding cassette subfamily C protein